MENNFIQALKFNYFNYDKFNKLDLSKKILENFNVNNILEGLKRIEKEKINYDYNIVQNYIYFLDSLVNYYEVDTEDLLYVSKIIHDLKEKRNLKEIISDINIYLENKDKPIKERVLTNWGKNNYVNYYFNYSLFDDNYDVNLFKKYIFELADLGDIDLKEKIAYLYHDNNLPYGFECDQSKTCEILEELMENDKVDDDTKGTYATTLGNIYYYGGENVKKDYEKAFKYYSIGSALDFCESTYKLADMFENGYYVGKNYTAAMNLVLTNINELEKEFIDRDYDSHYADLLIRLGNYKLKGIGCEVDKTFGFTYLYMAKKVLELRMKASPHERDSSLMYKLENQLNNLEYDFAIDKNVNVVSFIMIYAFSSFFNNDDGYSTIIQKELKNEYKFTLTCKKPVILVHPFYDYFNVTQKVSFYVKKRDVTNTNLINEKEYIMNHFHQDEYIKEIYNDNEDLIQFSPNAVFKVKK